MAPCFWNSPKVGKNEFKGEDFDFFPLENPLIKTTGRGPAGPLAGHPPSGTPATNYWRKCTTIRRTLTGTKTRGGRAWQLYIYRHQGGFQRRGGYWSPSFGTLFFPYSFRVYEKNMADNGYCILGGDILDLKFAHTYDNWFYEPISHLDNSDNIRNSVAAALHYIDMYIKLHGTTYHVSLVPTKL